LPTISVYITASRGSTPDVAAGGVVDAPALVLTLSEQQTSSVATVWIDPSSAPPTVRAGRACDLSDG
jgi:hypothetical protein